MRFRDCSIGDFQTYLAFIPIEGRALEFKLDSPEQGLIDWEFIEDDHGAVVKSRFLPSANLGGLGVKRN